MESVAVVAVPFPAQGHLNQLLHLSLQLAARGLPVHYAAPAEHVQFHELAISEYVSPPPDPAAGSPFPSHLIPLWEAFTASAPAPVAALLREASASHRRVVVLYDLMNGFVAEEAARLPNGEGFALVCTSGPPCRASSGRRTPGAASFSSAALTSFSRRALRS